MTPRVVWVSGEVPDVTLGGGSIRQAHLLRAVAETTETHLVVAGNLRDDDLRARLASVTSVEAGPVRRPESALRRRVEDLGGALFDSASPEVNESREVVAALAPVLRDALCPGDLVQVEHSGLAPLVSLRSGSSRWAITLHTVESERIGHRLALAPSPRRRWLLGREQSKARANEAMAAARYDRVWVTSREDEEAFPGAATLVPNGVDTAAFRPSPLPGGAEIVFTGTLDYLPNVEGTTWFCREVLPLVRDEVPAATVTIVGRRPVAEVSALASAARGVRVEADVDDVRPFLERSRVAVVPLRIGSGTRLKALEAMAAGRPVVGTSIGLAGLGVADGRGAMVADRPEDFARGVVEVLRDDATGVRLVREGRQIAEDHAWSAIAPAFVEQLLRLAPG